MQLERPFLGEGSETTTPPELPRAAAVPTKIAGGVIFGLIVLVTATAALRSGGDANTSSGRGEVAGTEAGATDAEEPSNKATEDNEPHVGPKGSVIVDTLTWKVLSANTAARIGNEFFRANADGVFVILRLSVYNDSTHSLTINSDIAKLEVSGNEYKYDSEATDALAITSTRDTFFLRHLDPKRRITAFVVFDIPPRGLRQNPELCFHEHGFGSTKACIRLPPP
jgi:hypothetical protein